MRRCDHGVYIGVNDERALYCSFCTPDGPLNTREVNLPHSGVGAGPGRIWANGKRSGDGCPECGSTIWCETNKAGRAECAECGATYRRRNKDVS